MVSCGTRRLIAIRQGRDTLVLADDEVVERRTNADACGACRCGDDGAAVAYTDGNLVVYQGDQALSLSTRRPRGSFLVRLGGTGDRSCGSPRMRASKRGAPGASVLCRCGRGDLPGTIASGSSTVDRPSGVRDATRDVAFRGGVPARTCRLRGVLPNRRAVGRTVWRTVDHTVNRWWLVEAKPLRQIPLGRGIRGRLDDDLDGNGRLYAASGSGPGVILDVETAEVSPLEDRPAQLSSAVGEPKGGCWFSDRRRRHPLCRSTGPVVSRGPRGSGGRFRSSAGQLWRVARLVGALESAVGDRQRLCDHVRLLPQARDASHEARAGRHAGSSCKRGQLHRPVAQPVGRPAPDVVGDPRRRERSTRTSLLARWRIGSPGSSRRPESSASGFRVRTGCTLSRLALSRSRQQKRRDLLREAIGQSSGGDTRWAACPSLRWRRVRPARHSGWPMASRSCIRVP